MYVIYNSLKLSLLNILSPNKLVKYHLDLMNKSIKAVFQIFLNDLLNFNRSE